MITLENAEKALKDVYLDVVANQLNMNANPLLGKIRQSTGDVWGKKIIKAISYGINGGIGAGTEDGTLPMASGTNYLNFQAELKNLFGKIDISDKAIRTSSTNTGAFVNLLNNEMENLIKSSSFNLGRMLYGDGSGVLATIDTATTSEDQVAKTYRVSSTNKLMEGMIVNIVNVSTGEAVSGAMANAKIVYVDRVNKQVVLDKAGTITITGKEGFVVQDSFGKEITGIGKIFGGDATLYGVNREENKWLYPYDITISGELSESAMQEVLDLQEEAYGTDVDFIGCSAKVRRLYQEYLSTFKRNIDIMELNGGYKAISYNGIPVVADRFIDEGEMFFLNTKDFTLHQLCDWEWLQGDDGRILKQNANHATYSATLVKYAELICDRPCAQARLKGITA